MTYLYNFQRPMNFILRSQRVKSNPNGRVSFFDASEYNAFVIAYRSGDTLPPFSIHDLLLSYELENPRLNRIARGQSFPPAKRWNF